MKVSFSLHPEQVKEHAVARPMRLSIENCNSWPQRLQQAKLNIRLVNLVKSTVSLQESCSFRKGLYVDSKSDSFLFEELLGLGLGCVCVGNCFEGLTTTVIFLLPASLRFF